MYETMYKIMVFKVSKVNFCVVVLILTNFFVGMRATYSFNDKKK